MPKKNHYPQKIVRGYLENLSQSIIVENGFIFGSYARGEARDYSDVDVIVISPNFRKMSFMKRLEFLSQMRKGKARTIAMDIIGYTPEEFKEMDTYSPNLEKIKKEAQAIFP
jgi:predicted nucleotidyltransferase